MRALLALLLLTTTSIASTPQPDSEKSYFIQYWTVPKSDRQMELNYDEPPGHVTVMLGDNTVSCAEAKTTKGWDGQELAPLSVGFMLKTTDISKLQFKMDGATNIYMNLQTKISPLY